MQRQTRIWLVWLGLLLAVALLVPGQGQATEERGPGYAMQRANLAKDLNLSPEKAQEFQAVGEKYNRLRTEIIERIRKNESELEKGLAAPQPDGGKIKALVERDHLRPC